MSSANGLVDVQMVGLDVDVYRQAAEHSDELLREFALIRGGEAAPGNRRGLPARLIELVDRLGRDFNGFGTRQRTDLRAAIDGGAPTIDLTYRVPPGVRGAAIELGRLLDEADEFCRQGDLLTLATPPAALAFRRWFLGEFVRQIDGEPPSPWPGRADQPEWATNS